MFDRRIKGKLVYTSPSMLSSSSAIYLEVPQKKLIKLFTKEEERKWFIQHEGIPKSYNYTFYLSLNNPYTGKQDINGFANQIVNIFNCLEKPLTLELYWYKEGIKDNKEPFIIEIGRKEVLEARKVLRDYIANGGDLDTSIALETLDEEEFLYNPIPKKHWHYFITKYFEKKVEDLEYVKYLNVGLDQEIESIRRI